MADSRGPLVCGLRRLQESGQTLLLRRPLTRVVVWILWSFGGEFHQQVWARNAILLGGPCAEINQLAAFRAERTPRIVFPGGGLTAERARHAGFYHAGG